MEREGGKQRRPEGEEERRREQDWGGYMPFELLGIASRPPAIDSLGHGPEEILKAKLFDMLEVPFGHQMCYMEETPISEVDEKMHGLRDNCYAIMG